MEFKQGMMLHLGMMKLIIISFRQQITSTNILLAELCGNVLSWPT